MLKNVSTNWLLTFAGIVTMYVLMPFTFHALGQEGYGTWTLITAMTGYLSLLMLGVPMASVRYIAQHVGDPDPRKLDQAVASCLGLYLVMGVLALLVGGALYLFFFSLYDLPAGVLPQARLAFIVVVVNVAAGFVGQVPQGILSAHQDFVARNVVLLGSLALRLMLTVVMLRWRAELPVLAAVQVCTLAFEIVVFYFVIRRRYPALRVRVHDFQPALVRRIFTFSLYVLLLYVGYQLTFQTNALIIGKRLDVAQVPYYTIGNSLIVYLLEFVIAIGAVVMPTATTLQTQGRVAELRDIFLKWSKIAFSLTLMVGLYLIVLGPRFIAWWIDPSFEGPSRPVLQILMLSSLLFLPARGVALPILMGLGKPKAPTIAFLVAGIVNVVLGIALAPSLGLAGVAIGTAVPNVAFAAYVLHLTSREVGCTLAEYLRYVLARPLLGALPALAILLWFRLGADVHGLTGLVVAGTSMVAVFATAWVLFVYRDDPYIDLRARVLPALRVGATRA